jgi:hypothetical protein
MDGWMDGMCTDGIPSVIHRHLVDDTCLGLEEIMFMCSVSLLLIWPVSLFLVCFFSSIICLFLSKGRCKITVWIDVWLNGWMDGCMACMHGMTDVLRLTPLITTCSPGSLMNIWNYLLCLQPHLSLCLLCLMLSI